MADGLFVSCAQVLALCQNLKDDLAALLDPQTGFAPRLRRICHDQLAEYEDNPGDGSWTPEMLDALRLEQNTWALLQAVMPARKTEPPSPPPPTARDLLRENPYTPTSTLAQAILQASPLLAELVVVREWLQETAPAHAEIEATTGYWRFTKHAVMQALRLRGGAAGFGRNEARDDGLVKEMDPDAPTRESGRGLASDDTAHEKALVQALYALVRAGRLDSAAALCRRAHQPWRAASIRGALLFRWTAIANQRDLDQDLEEDEEPELGWSGNPRRKIWKAACARGALNPALPQPERVLLAALAPTPSTTAILKSSCRTWEDHVWVQVNVACEERINEEISRLGQLEVDSIGSSARRKRKRDTALGSFWEGGLAVVENEPEAVQNSRDQSMDEDEAAIEDDLEDEEWEKEVTSTLEGLQTVPVQDGAPADHPFHFSQLNIILGRTSALLDGFAEGLKSGRHRHDHPDYINMCRFFAHLCLFLQMIDIPVPPLATQVILEAYLQILEAAGQRDLIALYASALGENAIERYALFLTSLDVTVDAGERRLALTQAREHGLDIDRVAIVTAERTIERAFQVLPPPEGRLPSMTTMQPPPSDAETLLLRSIEWTTFFSSTFETALEQTNVILRYFLGIGRVQAAQQLLAMLPPELTSLGEPEERATEYLHYRQFFTIWEALARVVECAALEVPHMSREMRNAWVKDYATLIDAAEEKIMKLLTSEWLVTDVETGGGDHRRQELIRIRQIYIPELIIRLHQMLFTSRHTIPENLKRALVLANVVADSRYKLYEDFVNDGGRQLSEYVSAVRQATLGGLERGGSDPFRVLAG